MRAGDVVRAAAVSDNDGAFRINVPLAADEESLEFAVTAPSGFVTVASFAVTIDRLAPVIAVDEPLPRLTAQPELRIAGTTDRDATLTLNGRALALADGRFDETVTLQPGINPIELIATDPIGNLTVEKASVKLDQDAPRLVSSSATPVTSGGQRVLSVEVIAEDQSGLAKAAPFVVAAGPDSYSGYLRYNKAAKSYQGFVVIPEADLAAARLRSVELRDDAGNSQTFDLPEPL